ncbi:MAG TPA: KOW motif-containing protein [Ktedonobacterales bacterium]|jgi:transcriptional antiterminator NusG|nr:KOW motif-containing protein [Ktedonobacterales bacterium]
MDEMGETPPYPRKGQSVRVVEGPFAGFEGTAVAVDGARRRVQVVIMFFGRKTIIAVDVLHLQIWV